MEWLSRFVSWIAAKRSERAEDRAAFQALNAEWKVLYEALRVRVAAVEQEAHECQEARKTDHARILHLEAKVAELERTR